MPGTSPRTTTKAAVVTATIRSITPKTFQATSTRGGIVFFNPMSNSAPAIAAVVISPQPARSANNGESSPRAPNTRKAMPMKRATCTPTSA